MNISERPKQWQADVGEIVVAYFDGGQSLANRSYKAICEARKLLHWQTLALSDDVRRVISDNDDWRKTFNLT